MMTSSQTVIMRLRVVLGSVLVLYLMGNCIMASATCPKEAVNITASLEPGWKYQIQSPGFPNNYQKNQTCTWHVIFPDSMGTLSQDYQMMLVFDALEIEHCTFCACDYIAHASQENTLQSSLNKKCQRYSSNFIGYLKERDYSRIRFSSGSGNNGWWLRFRSDPSKELKGFQGNITVIRKTGRTSCLDSENVINATSGSISSPQYPMQYLANQVIDWCLIVPEGYRVKLTFKAFELENSRTKDNDCLNDYVEVRDGKMASRGELLGRFCGSTTPGEILSVSNMMYVVFVSDTNSSTTYNGFNAHFVNGGTGLKTSFASFGLGLVFLILKNIL